MLHSRIVAMVYHKRAETGREGVSNASSKTQADPPRIAVLGDAPFSSSKGASSWVGHYICEGGQR